MSKRNSLPIWQRALQFDLSEVVILDLAKIITDYVPKHTTDVCGRKGIRVFGLYQGPFVSYYDNECKQLKYRVIYVNGQHGFNEGWYENGQQQYKKNFVNGQWHGFSEGWYKNGQQWYKHIYVNGQKHGTDEGWYKNGHQRYKWNYVNGQLHGVYEVWYYNGQQMMKSNYVNGQKM